MDRGDVWLLNVFLVIGIVLWLVGVPWMYISAVEFGCAALMLTPVGMLVFFKTREWNGWSYDDGSPDEDPPILDRKLVVFFATVFLVVGIKALWLGKMEFMAFLLTVLGIALIGMFVLMAKQRTSRAGE